MHFIIIILLILVIALALLPICLHADILVKDLAAKRHYMILLLLMLLALSCARIIEAKTGSFAAGLISGPMILVLGYLPVIYIDYLQKRKSAGYKGAWKKIGDWLDQPIKTLFSRKG
jgi:hypothetical protein